MIGMMKKAFPWKTKRKQIVYNAFRPYGGDGILRIKKAQNCAFSNGTLQTGLAIEPCFSLAGNTVEKVNYSNAIAVWPLRFLQEDGITLKEQISVLSNTGFLYFYDETTKTLTNKIRPGDQTNAVYLRSPTGEQKWLFVGDRGVWLMDEEFSIQKQTAIKDVSGALCVCKNRAFLGKKMGKVLYSSPLVPWDFGATIDDGGEIVLPLSAGTPVGLAAVEDYVYIFCLKEIYRLRVAGSARDFRLERIPYDGEEICCGSFGVVEKGVIFLSCGGLWKVTDKKVKRICSYLNVNPMSADNRCQCAVGEGSYFLRYRETMTQRKTLAVDTDGENGYDCRDMETIGNAFGKMVFLYNGMLYSFHKKGENSAAISTFTYKCESEETDFGISGKKLLKKLTFYGEGAFTVGVYCDGKYHERTAVFEDGVAEVDFNARGERFSFVFILQNGCEIRQVSVTLETLS